MESELKSGTGLNVTEKKQEIKVPPGELGAVLELIVRNKKGEITQRQAMRSRSFVKQFLQGLWLFAAYRYFNWPVMMKRTDATEIAVTLYQNDWECNAAANSDTYGILVGMGTTAPTIDDYDMETKIAHGVGAGQLQYSAVTFGAPTEDGTVSHFTITRDFSNASGAAVTVREIGLVVRFYDTSGPSAHNFLTIRDAVNITVPNGETLTVNYRIQATV